MSDQNNDGMKLQERIKETSEPLTALVGITTRGGVAALDGTLAQLDADELRSLLAGAVAVIIGDYLAHRQAAAHEVQDWEQDLGDDPVLQ
jgi:hypothetical protein